MRIAIVGAGISGLTAAYLLSREHDVTVYEADSRIGGHTATKNVKHKGQTYDIDTGFIVFNDWTYPGFQKLLGQLGVDSQKTSMGFSVSCEASGLEYSGNSLNAFFAQRGNIVKWQHWRMLKDILRFNKEALSDVKLGGQYHQITLGEYLRLKVYSRRFIDNYLIPMGAAIWSSSTAVIENFPLKFFVEFFKNHGLLSINERPQWYVIKGGSHAYLKPLIKTFEDNIYINSPVKSIHRMTDEDTGKKAIAIAAGDQSTQHYDHVIIACHSDQALSVLTDIDENEASVLGKMTYRNNEVVLHTDDSLLPDNKNTWSSWNYYLPEYSDNNMAQNQPPILTYNMNILQNLESSTTFCVTLNATEKINPDNILGVYQYAHPVFSIESVSAQQQWSLINGDKNTWFCGAYWGNGFHEDGVASAIRVAQKFGIEL